MGPGAEHEARLRALEPLRIRDAHPQHDVVVLLAQPVLGFLGGELERVDLITAETASESGSPTWTSSELSVSGVDGE